MAICAATLLAAFLLFSPLATAPAATVTVVTADNGLPARSVQWTDANGQPRTAIMVDQRAQGAGYLRQLTYQVNGGSRTSRGTGANGHQGDGYVQNHTAYGGDSSSHFTPGTTTVALAGAHHVIISYEMPTYNLAGQTVPTTVQWFFADGRSHPLFAISQDARATAGNLAADSRSPYGDVAYDGGAGTTVGGASFGDTYKFVTLAANPEQVTRASGWRYNEANTIPYAMQWSDPAQADAEMGHVGTLPISVKDQGSDPRTFPVVDVRGQQQLNGPMIDDENWSYQILNYVLPANGPTGSKRLTWGSNWGLPGGFDNFGTPGLNVRQYSQHASSTLGHAFDGARADGMLMAYSVFVVLGTHTGGYLNGTVGQAVKQMENAAAATLTAVTGSVKTSGPAGVGNAASVTTGYIPGGYSGTYSTWELTASANTVDATLTPANGRPLDHPLIVVNNYTLGQLPASISVGNGLATPDVDYFATVDTVNQRLWITVNRLAATAINIKVTAVGGPQLPAITSFPLTGYAGSTIIITGLNFSGANAVTFNGVPAVAFTVDSPTQISAVVPAGATAGPIAVTTPGGTATSAASFTPLQAQSGTIAGTFRQMDTDGGGWFTGFAVHATGRLYGRTDVGGLYRSDDHGDTWNYLSGDFTSYTGHCVQGVAVAPGNVNVVYQCVGFAFGGAEQGIWKSTDGGGVWTQVKSGIHFSGNDAERWGGECLAIRPGNDAEVWAGSRGDGLWRTSNSGGNWSQLGVATFAGAQFTSVSLPPVGRSDIWVGASGFSGPGGVWVSVDEGASWTQITGNQNGVGAPQGCWRITRQPNGKVLVAGGNGALGSVLYEFNAADWNNPAAYTWADISWPGIDRGQAAPLVAALADGRIIAGSIFGGYNGGPNSLRTQIRSLAGTWSPTDSLNGAMPAWQRSPAPVLIEGGRNSLVQDPTDANRWFMAGGYGPFRTTDGGASWQYVVNGVDEVVNYKVRFHPTDASRVYLPMADHGGAVVLDGGASGTVSRYVTTRALPYPDDLGLSHAMLASGDRLLALGADERNNWRPRIFRSTDNGVSWSVLAHAGLPNQDNRCIISAVASRDVADDILVAIAGIDDGVNGGVYRSVNGGATFVRATGLPAGADYGDQFNPNADLEVDATDNGIRYLFLKNRGLYKSTNRGAGWSAVDSGLPSYGVMAADGALGGHLWVGTCCGQPVGLSRSTDSGAGWSTIPGFISVADVDAVNDRVAVLGQRTGDTFNRVYFSADGGGTWGEITRPGFRFGNAHAVAVDPWRVGTVWISSNGRSVATFTPGAAAAPTLTLTSESGYAGLKIVSGPNQYDRQNIATDTTSNDYGWIGGGATPVTYTMRISAFPSPSYSGFQAHIFLVPNATGAIAPDYDGANVVMLDIQGQADGSATAWFRYKINEAGGNNFLYGAGTLGHLDCPSGAVGAWGMSFLNDTAITLTAPNGSALPLSFPGAAGTIQAAFGGKVAAYFGNQPNAAAQAGQFTIFSRIQISGAPRAQPLDETFPGPLLNQHPVSVSWFWTKPAVAPAGITIPASTDLLALSWSLPDTGFVLQFNPGLTGNGWVDLSLPNIVTQPASRIVRVSRAALPNAASGFFRMIHLEP